ncbi:MAG: helix-turn-helix transcriptional regulator [Sporolactobacillus sp.]
MPEVEGKFHALGQFLKKRRASISPEQVGLKENANRRVEGLRREEVADLAGVSVDWYTRLEQGRPVRPSVSVLASICHVLQLNRKESLYLFSLAEQRIPNDQTENLIISSAMQQFLDAQLPYPAYITDKRWNMVAWNQTTLEVFGNYDSMSRLERNTVWRAFTDPSMRELLDDWSGHAKRRVSQLRLAYGQSSDEVELGAFIRQLQERSPLFKEWWNDQTICGTPEGKKLVHHPVVGDIRLNYISFQSEELPGATVTIHIACDRASLSKLQSL